MHLRHGSSALLRLESIRQGSGINASLLQNLVASAHVSDWEIDPQRLKLCERPDGSVWELGRGAYSRVCERMDTPLGDAVLACVVKGLSCCTTS